MSSPTITLNDAVQIPQLGFGTWQVPAADAERVVGQAIELGYRHLDTAQMYRNEAGVGAAVRASGLPREELFVTSKLSNGAHDPADALAAFDRSMDALGLDQLDLFLIHWPLPQVGDFVETWRALEQIAASGRCRAIGVSNFQPHHVERLLAETGTVPAVNQIEVHPYFVQDEVRAHNHERGIVVEAWSPLAQGTVLGDPVVTAVAAELGCTASQVVLSWHLRRGDVVFPKSVTPSRMAENLAAGDVTLTDEQMARITGLDRVGRIGPDPDTLNATG